MKKLWNENRFFIVSLIIIFVLFQIKLPYYVNAPGGTIDISDRISYEKMEKYNGSLNMLYVTEYVATIPSYLLSFVIRDWDLEDIRDSQVSNESVQEIEYRNKIMLENSINAAKYVAYKAALKKISVSSEKFVIIGMTLDNGLKIGDEVLKIDDQVVESLVQIKNIIDSKKALDEISLLIKRDGKEMLKKVKIQEVDGHKVLGIIIVKNSLYDTDPEVKLKFKASESGSSGGMMMALSIYCAISGEDLLKGRDVAGTGTIDEAGNVGEISGIKYKIMGAYRNHMDVVLVPSANYKEAKKVVKEKNYDMEVVEIKTFEEAIQYLRG